MILRRWIRRAEKAAGLPETGRCHVFRHTFASHLAMASVPAKTIQGLARHTSIMTTARYMHLSPSAADAGIDALDAWRRGTTVARVDGRGEIP
jgi:integrase